MQIIDIMNLNFVLYTYKVKDIIKNQCAKTNKISALQLSRHLLRKLPLNASLTIYKELRAAVRSGYPFLTAFPYIFSKV